MLKHELGLFENAVDSLNEALKKYEEGIAGNQRAFKFAILHFSHGIELLLKHYVSLSHPLLIYKNPHSKNINRENTIGAWDAIQFLRNEGHELSEAFDKDFEWFKTLRNDIEHNKFSLNIEKVKLTLGKLMQALNELNDVVETFQLKKHIEPQLLTTFDILADEYKAKLAAAREKADHLSDSGFAYGCWQCGNHGTVSRNKGVYLCHSCGNEVHEINCCICGHLIPEPEAIVWNRDTEDYICEACHNRFN